MRRKTLNELTGNEVLAKDILTDDFLTILPKGAVLKPEYINKLKELDIKEVFIKENEPKAEEIAILKAEVESNVKEKVKDILERHTYQHNEELVALCETADNIIVNIIQEEEVAEQVFDIKERNADIYEHSLNVCTMAVLAALKLELPQDVIHQIGVGCLLHDIGLRYQTIDFENQDIFNLSEADLAEYKKHPVYGYSALKNEHWISDLSKNIILYHHERLDGSGYPLRATTLNEAIEIVNVCDTFDELICGIGCKKVKVYEAIEYLKAYRNIKFSSKIVDTFLEFTAVYPVGTKVMTNEKELAVVIRQNKEFSDRPVLRILADADGNEITEEIIKDMVKIHHIFIDKVME